MHASNQRLITQDSAFDSLTRRRTSGFALVLAITLVALLLMVVMSFAYFTRAEYSQSITQQQADAARQNALVALRVALGELQAAAGPDQRTTATGELWNVPAVGTQNLVGVWDTAGDQNQSEDLFVRWLVSDGDQPAIAVDQAAFIQNDIPIAYASQRYATADDRYAILVGAGSVEEPNYADTAQPENGIAAAKESVIGDNGETVGHYAWWVGDEGSKARVDLIDASADNTLGGDDRVEAIPFASASMPRVAGEMLGDFGVYTANSPTLDKV